MIWAYIKVRTQLHHRPSLAPSSTPPLRRLACVLICESMFGLGLWSGHIYSTRLCRQGEPRSVHVFRLCFVSRCPTIGTTITVTVTRIPVLLCPVCASIQWSGPTSFPRRGVWSCACSRPFSPPRCSIRARGRAILPLPYDFPRLLRHSGIS